MRFFLKLIASLFNIFGRKKKRAKEMDDIPKDNYPMF
jgi:hypothetical protein